MDTLRMTYPTAAVLQALDRDHRYGFEIAQAWEDPEQHRDEGRPPRKYYRLSAEARPTLERARTTYPLPEPSGSTAAATRG